MPRPNPSQPDAIPGATIAALRTGDESALHAVLTRYQTPLFTYAQELLHHETAALDLVQDTFITAHRHLTSLRDEARFGSWLFGIAHQKIIQHWRRAGREEPTRSLPCAPPLRPSPPCTIPSTASPTATAARPTTALRSGA